MRSSSATFSSAPPPKKDTGNSLVREKIAEAPSHEGARPMHAEHVRGGHLAAGPGGIAWGVEWDESRPDVSRTTPFALY